MPTYCRACVLPDTRPGVKLDGEGICVGCRNAEVKARIDWQERAGIFARIAAEARGARASYDCVIPVSGGKDSYWQVLTCLEHDLRPLCVTYVYPGRTSLGERNLRNLIRLGVDHIELRVNPEIERRFTRRAFCRKGISGLVSHMGVFSFPISTAVRCGIPLVVYGENSAFEYGTRDKSLIGGRLDRRWLRSFGVTDGTDASDWINDTLTANELAAYTLPSDEALAASGVKVLFLGWYFSWDPTRSYRLASAHGFEARKEGARVGHLNYVNIDDDMLGVHHHAKWHKFGITRSFDTLSVEIRMGRMTRREAIEALRSAGDETPWDDIRLFCDYVGLSIEQYFDVLEQFRNRDIWTRRDGRWVIEDFLIDDFRWPEDFSPGAPKRRAD